VRVRSQLSLAAAEGRDDPQHRGRHLDCYKNIDEIIESFRTFAKLVPADGLIIANGNDANVAKAVGGLAARVETVSLSPGTTWSTCPSGNRPRRPADWRGLRNGEPVGMLKLSVAGEHNLMNATMALAACVASGVEAGAAHRGALQLHGRRSSHDRRWRHFRGATSVDEYGHHPT
jgi:UDP-N-acetylmuramate--alanine ligase